MDRPIQSSQTDTLGSKVALNVNEPSMSGRASPSSCLALSCYADFALAISPSL